MQQFTKRKWLITAIVLSIYGLLYISISRITPFPEIPISYSWLDLNLPYLSWTSLFYITFYPLLALPLLLCETEILFNKLLKIYLTLIVISMLIFFFFPTNFRWNLTQYSDFLTQYIMVPIRSADNGMNALPSNHVAFSVIGSMFYFYHNRFKKAMFFGIWGIFVSLSTVFVKQHFVLDGIAGFLLALTVLLIVEISSPNTSSIPKTL